jgi:putative tricarboxylic transport membrane protein
VVSKTVKLSFDALVVAIFTYAAIEATTFTPGGRWLPLFVASAGAILAVVNIVLDAVGAFRKRNGDSAEAQEEQQREQEFEEDVKSALYWLVWLVGFAVMVIVFGMMIAAPVWLGVFLRTQAKVGWMFTGVSVVGIVAFLYVFSTYLPLVLPPGLFS